MNGGWNASRSGRQHRFVLCRSLSGFICVTVIWDIARTELQLCSTKPSRGKFCTFQFDPGLQPFLRAYPGLLDHYQRCWNDTSVFNDKVGAVHGGGGKFCRSPSSQLAQTSCKKITVCGSMVEHDSRHSRCNRGEAR